MKTIAGFLWIIILAGISSCSKNQEFKEIEVDKKYSWTELKRFSGTERIFLSSGSSAEMIYLQQPYFFSAVQGQNINSGITTYAAGLPTDIEIRLPITANFTAFPFNDTVLRVINNTVPTVSPSGGYFNIRKIDPSLTKIQKYFNILFKVMAVNKNGTLLLAYENNRPSRPLTLMMLKIKTNNTGFPDVDTVYSRTVAIPRTNGEAYIRHMAAVDDYFMVDLSGNGIYKIREDGSATRVFSPATVNAFIDWKGKTYALAEESRLLISEDNGDNWQEYSGNNSVMTASNYYSLKDSLVGAYRDNIFTLNWSGSTYKLRFLKNDGVEGTRINGIEILRDTVYLATTGGLFTKPVRSFFDSK